MENHEANLNIPEWIKNGILPVVICVIFFVFINYKLDEFESSVHEMNKAESVILDFQNKSGVARMKTGFADILVASAGSRKRDNGYELFLKVINPSSIFLRNIKTEFRHVNLNKVATCGDINMIIPPGSSRVLTCFVADLSDSDLKSVEVMVDFDQISFY
jgi:hypothetical protein